MATQTIRRCSHCGKPVDRNSPYCSIDCQFWSKVLIKQPDECWPWIGARLKSGYGVMAVRREGVKSITTAHRISLAIKLGRPITDDLHSCHSCDVNFCVNPAHLFEGTAKANNEDKVAKGRQSKGDKHGRSSLSEADARAILSDPRKHEDIAGEYDISRSHVTTIKLHKAWKHLI